MTDFTAKFADGVSSWGAGLAYGPTATLGGVDVLPVAVVAFGFGAGQLDRNAPGGQSGEGGGGSGVSLPIGVYMGGAGAARFVPNTLAAAVAAASVITAVGAAVSAIVRVAGWAAGRRRS